MQIISRSELRAIKETYVQQKGFTALNEAVKEHGTRLSKVSEVTVFLSHKHEEEEDLKNAIALLKKLDVNVYVDWMDEDMPKTTSGATAAALKKKIVHNKKFILLATEKAISSKWCNWELGLGDAAKYLNHIALLPVKDDYGAWSGNEYLQIYPVIGKKYSWSDNYYEVSYPDGKSIDLDKWLKQ
jgi:hypothetical protein